MAKRPTNRAKVKIWTEHSTADLIGPIKSCVYHMFQRVPEADRLQLLADMKQWHEEKT